MFDVDRIAFLAFTTVTSRVGQMRTLFKVGCTIGLLCMSGVCPYYAVADYEEFKRQKEVERLYNLLKGAEQGRQREYEQRYRAEHSRARSSDMGDDALVVLCAAGMLMSLGLLAIIVIRREARKERAKCFPISHSNPIADGIKQSLGAAATRGEFAAAEVYYGLVGHRGLAVDKTQRAFAVLSLSPVPIVRVVPLDRIMDCEVVEKGTQSIIERVSLVVTLKDAEHASEKIEIVFMSIPNGDLRDRNQAYDNCTRQADHWRSVLMKTGNGVWGTVDGSHDDVKPATSNGGDRKSIAEELMLLAQLLERNHLTQEEFDSQKKALLAKELK